MGAAGGAGRGGSEIRGPWRSACASGHGPRRPATRERGAAGERGDPPTAPSRSSAPARWRCVEVLRDRLLVAFDELPGLRPEDVLIACPDPEAFAPHVEAAFEGTGLRVHLAGRSPRRERAAVSRDSSACSRRSAAGPRHPKSWGSWPTRPSPRPRGWTPRRRRLGADAAAAGITVGIRRGAPGGGGPARSGDARLGSRHRPPRPRLAAAAAGRCGGHGRRRRDAAAATRRRGGPGGPGGERRGVRASRRLPRSVEGGVGAGRRARRRGGLGGGAVDWTESFLADGDDDFGRAQVRKKAAAKLAADAAAAGLSDPLPLSVWTEELGRRLDGLAGGGRFRPGGITLCEPAAAGPAAPRDRVAGPHRRLLPAADGGPGLRPLGAGAPARRPAGARRRSLAAAGVADVGGRPLPRGLRGPRPARPAAAAGGRRRRVARRRGTLRCWGERTRAWGRSSTATRCTRSARRPSTRSGRGCRGSPRRCSKRRVG